MKKTWSGNPSELRQWPEGLWTLAGHNGEAGLHEVGVREAGVIDLGHNGGLAVEAASNEDITRCCHTGEYTRNQ